MSDSATTRMRFETHDAPLALEAAFDGGRLTSDGGLVWLAEADRELGLCEEIASHIPEWRGPSVRHSLEMLVRQRVYQIASGYEDQNDADSLRSDPLLKLVCGRLPETDADLASQPTICRLENAPDARACLHIARALGELYVSERSEGGVPERVLLDFDSTDDPTHGEQEGSYYHGFYKTRMYHPLVVFDEETNQLVAAVLRAGNTHASRGALSVLKRVVRRLREAWGQGVQIEIRADAGFAVPAVYEWCEEEGVGYTIGLVSNPRLEALAEALLERAEREYEAQEEGEKVRLVSEAPYRAHSWERSRRVIYKAEVLEKGTNTRFVVTSKESEEPSKLYDWYVKRGEAEGWIKDFKRALKADRLSCHRFFANQFRLLLHAAAYWLLDALRRRLVEAGVRRMQLDTLRLSLVKIGGRVRELTTKVRLHLASGHPGQRLWQALSLARLQRLRE
jgi:Transposase DDE domain group 1